MVPNNKDAAKDTLLGISEQPKVANKDSALSVQVGGDHYKNYKIQPIDFIYLNGMSFIEGCIIKYICRYKNKGTPIEDLKKIKHYIDILIEKEKEGLNSASKAAKLYYSWDNDSYYHDWLRRMESYRQDPVNYQRSSDDS